MNRLLTNTEFYISLNEILDKCCKDSGITRNEFDQGFVKAWNSSIEKEEKELLNNQSVKG